MIRKFIVVFGMVLVAVAIGAIVWLYPAQGSEINTSTDAQAVEATILRSLRIDAEANYTFDPSQLSTVYINDPRGGGITPKALAVIQKVRQDSSIQADQVGILDYHQALIERRKRAYDLYIADLRSKQADGTLSEEEKMILDGETNGWPTPVPIQPLPTSIPTPPSSWEVAPYPEANPLPLCSPPDPTPNPTPDPPGMMVPHRGPNPAMLPPDTFQMDIYSVEIEGEVAKAVGHQRAVTSEMVLVKVDGQWYIAGGRLIEYSP